MYEKVVEKYGERVLQHDLFDWKARMRYVASALQTKSLTLTGHDRTVVMEKRDEENDTLQEGVAILIDFTQHKGEKLRDSMRRQLAKLLLNLICTWRFGLRISFVC